MKAKKYVVKTNDWSQLTTCEKQRKQNASYLFSEEK